MMTAQMPFGKGSCLPCYFSDQHYDPYGLYPYQEVTSSHGEVWSSDTSEKTEAIYEHFSPSVSDHSDLYRHTSRPIRAPRAVPMEQTFPYPYGGEVTGIERYAPAAGGYEPKHHLDGSTAHRFSTSDDGGIPRHTMAYELTPPGGFLPSGQRAPRIHVRPTPGYPCGPVLCTQVTSVAPPPSSGMARWLYPPCPTTSSSYAFPPSIPCVPQTSHYPVVYPPPVFLGYLPHPMSPNGDERRATEGSDIEKADCLRASFASSRDVLRENEAEGLTRHDARDASSKTPRGKSAEKTTIPQTKETTAHGRVTSSTAVGDITIHTKLSNINDRVLAEFKTKKSEKLGITDIRGHLLPFCLDQTGSRFIQDQLAICTARETEIVHEELAPHALNLMRDVFGNYIIQILIQNGSHDHRSFLAEIVKEHAVSLSLHVYGCRVVQKALEELDDPIRTDIVLKLEDHVVRCIKDMNGNHVIQKAIRVFDLEAIAFITKAVHDRVLSFSVHPYGCRVVQRVLEKESSDHSQNIARQEMMSVVAENVGELSQDLYGNYVVQHVLRYSPKPIRSKAISALMLAPVDYACHKYASNVLEQALVYGDQHERQEMIHTIISSPRRGDAGDALSMLTTNRFGNYVVQRMLDVAEDAMKCAMASSIGQRIKTLKKFKYGKHIVARVEKMLACPTDGIEEMSEGDSFCAYTIA